MKLDNVQLKNRFCRRLSVWAAAALLWVSCSGGGERQRIVSVTVLPLQYFAGQIAGDKFEINCVVPAGNNPEAYDPSPSQLAAVDRSEAYFRTGGLGFEVAWLDKLCRNNPGMKLYDMSAGIDLLRDTHDHDAPGEPHEEGFDPHIWSSPRQARAIARNMYDAFVELDPDNRDYYRQNYGTLLAEIDRVDSLLTAVLEPVRGQTFVIYHPSLSYLARDYGLRQLSVEHNGKTPSAYYMKQLVDTARACGVDVIFIQKEFDVKQVQMLAGELDCRVVPVNPLNYDWSDELEHIAYAFTRP